MGFIMEFAEQLIRNSMEDPKQRERKRREHLYAVKQRCIERIEETKLPLRPYGFWTMEKHTLRLNWDKQMSNARGRTDPYDNISADPFDFEDKK
ncbi:uncharacterized protein LOC131064255 [Cryptomeria japonica]|uniref:uncharacterized protein LOC131064255 n=1 Tax=Cryptomeria japonica TaxID=3369 RepID=UPI0025ABE76B|nr:uncharacterized protein LOC131064255 [Cryptomeria japonica]